MRLRLGCRFDGWWEHFDRLKVFLLGQSDAGQPSLDAVEYLRGDRAGAALAALYPPSPAGWYQDSTESTLRTAPPPLRATRDRLGAKP